MTVGKLARTHAIKCPRAPASTLTASTPPPVRRDADGSGQRGPGPYSGGSSDRSVASESRGLAAWLRHGVLGFASCRATTRGPAREQVPAPAGSARPGLRCGSPCRRAGRGSARAVERRGSDRLRQDHADGAMAAALAAAVPPQVYVAWLNLDENDNDPPRLLRYLYGALGKCVPTLAREAVQEIALTTNPAVMLEDLGLLLAAHGRPIVLFLDDAHVITNPDAARSLEWLLGHAGHPPAVRGRQPPGGCLAAGRAAAARPIARNRPARPRLQRRGGAELLHLAPVARLEPPRSPPAREDRRLAGGHGIADPRAERRTRYRHTDH